MKNAFTLLLLAAAMVQTQAHEGHGLSGAVHFHATDSVWVLLAALAGGALWLGRRK